MRPVPFRLAAPATLLLSLLAHAPAARAQDATGCDSCESCTTALAAPQARVALSRDLEATGAGPCIVVRGVGAQIDGREHAIRAGAVGVPVGVRVEGPGAFVRNVRVVGTAVGIEVAGAAHVTLFHDTIEATDTGIRVTAAEDLRIQRAQVAGGRVGIAFGELAGERCPEGARLRSPGAVVHRTHVEGAGIGLAACDAVPVLTENILVHNDVGLLLGAPVAGVGAAREVAPVDACVCAPALDHVRAGTTLLFSSGCGGCMVHEGWLPGLRASGHDIRLRETGTANAAAQQRFDAFVTHCAPEVVDALGIPGCVPNYACLANGRVFKTRRGENAVDHEAELDSAEAVARFAEACVAAAAEHYRPGQACVRHQLRGNTVCGSRRVDIRAASGAQRFGGTGDACNTTEGWREGATGCASPCPAELPRAPGVPVAAASTPPDSDPNSPPNSSPHSPPNTAPVAPRAEGRTAAHAGTTGRSLGLLWLGGGAAAGLVFVLARSMSRRRDDDKR
jgi:hypothetical protein